MRASGVKRGRVLRKSVLSKVVLFVDFAGEEALAERAVGDEADAEFFESGDDFFLGGAGPQGVFALKRGERAGRRGRGEWFARRLRRVRSA